MLFQTWSLEGIKVMEPLPFWPQESTVDVSFRKNTFIWRMIKHIRKKDPGMSSVRRDLRKKRRKEPRRYHQVFAQCLCDMDPRSGERKQVTYQQKSQTKMNLKRVSGKFIEKGRVQIKGYEKNNKKLMKSFHCH